MQGGWRLAASLPLGVAIPGLVVTIQGMWQGSNLWPLPLMFLTPVLRLYQVRPAAAPAGAGSLGAA